MNKNNRTSRYYAQYPMNFYETQREMKLWDDFTSLAEQNFMTKRTAMLLAMQLYVENYGSKSDDL